MVDIETYRARIGRFGVSCLSRTTVKLKLKLKCKVQRQVSMNCSVQTLIFLWMVASATMRNKETLCQEQGNTYTGTASNYTDFLYSETQLCIKFLFEHKLYKHILESFTTDNLTEIILFFTPSHRSSLALNIWTPRSKAQETLMELNDTVHGTCSYLIRNVGSHAYHGNPPKKGEQNICDLHNEMVFKLSQKIAPVKGNQEMENLWQNFIEMFRGSELLSDVEIAGLKNMFDVFNVLLRKGKIKHGEYEVVKEKLSSLELMECLDIITDYEKKMTPTSGDEQQDFPQELGSPKPDRLKGKGQTKQHHLSDETLNRSPTHLVQLSSAETVYSPDVAASSESKMPSGENSSLQENVVALAKHAQGFAETVTKQDVAASSESKMPSVDMEASVKVWEIDDKFCYETKGVKEVVKKICSDEHSHICIVGEPGSGKSTAIRHAALYLKDKHGYIIYPVYHPEQFINYLNPHTPQIFIIDDVLGEYFIDHNKLKVWNKYNEKIKNCLQVHKKIKFLFSLRVQLYSELESRGNTHIYNDQRYVINFCNKHYKLCSDVMKAMLGHYLQVKRVHHIDDLITRVWWERAEQFAGCFPLLCKVFSEDESVRLEPGKYFSYPLPALLKIFKRIKSENKYQFCGLVLCGITELKDDCFSPLSEVTKPKYFNSLVESQNLDPKKDLLDIKSALLTLDGVYISHIGNRYIFLHSIFQNIVTFLYDDKYYVFKYATRDFIHTRVRLFSKYDTDDDYVKVYCEDDCVELLVDRMVDELQSDDIDWSGDRVGVKFIVDSHYIGDKELITRLMEKLFDSNHKQITQDRIYELFGGCLEAVCYYTPIHPQTDETSCPHYKLLLSLIARCDCNKRICWRLLGDYPLLLSVKYGVLTVTKALLKQKVDVNVVGTDKRCVLHWAVKCQNNVDMTKYLLNLPNLKCLNYKNRWGHTPYWYVVNTTSPSYVSVVVPHKDELIELFENRGAICE